MDLRALLDIALDQARTGLAAGGVPIGAVLADGDGTVLGVGHNRNFQHLDPTAHAEIEAVRDAGVRDGYAGCVLVSTMAPCWMCAGMVHFLGIERLAFGDARTWPAEPADWLERAGMTVTDLEDGASIELVAQWIRDNPTRWRWRSPHDDLTVPPPRS